MNVFIVGPGARGHIVALKPHSRLERFGGRAVPAGGCLLTVVASGETIAAVPERVRQQTAEGRHWRIW